MESRPLTLISDPKVQQIYRSRLLEKTKTTPKLMVPPGRWFNGKAYWEYYVDYEFNPDQSYQGVLAYQQQGLTSARNLARMFGNRLQEADTELRFLKFRTDQVIQIGVTKPRVSNYTVQLRNSGTSVMRSPAYIVVDYIEIRP